ncbi:MAG: alpha/beta hydrolase, partial [Acidobacteriia bacterium]|nr:alpha/beta hydrolase [Terriglobia bacterium]
RERTAPARAAMAAPFQEVARVEDRTVPGPGGPIPVRIYWPELHGGLPALVYFHGGGWVLGNIESVDRTCRALARSSGSVVVNVEYRLAPEHQFPAAAEDAYAVTDYVASHPEAFGCDAQRIAVGGDSAGGNLAAVVCLMARDRGGPPIAFQLLVYPLTDYDDARPSSHEYAEGYFLTQAAVRYFWDQYVASPEEGRQPYASPLNAASFAGLPPAMIITAECDPLRDQGEVYARRLAEAGVPVELRRYDGAIHVFFQMSGALDTGKRALADAGAALGKALLAQEGAAV